MHKYYAKENIYDEKGVLLLAKGQEITKETILKLKKWKAINKIHSYIEKSHMTKFESNSDINQYSEDLINKFNIIDVNIINISNKILYNILFNSKEKPWWMFINALSNYVDWVYSHSINVALLSLMIAIKLNYDKTRLEKIALGALLHDVGKLLIPKYIIVKTEKLSQDDMLLIHKHCELGEHMLRNIDIPHECLNIIMQHHERIDGSGYPYGLKNNEISDEAKIVMVIDSLDAMTSFRPYNNSIKKIDKAFDEIKSNTDKFPKEIILPLESFIHY